MAHAFSVRPVTVELSTRSFAVSVTERAKGPDPNPYSSSWQMRPKPLSVKRTMSFCGSPECGAKSANTFDVR